MKGTIHLLVLTVSLGYLMGCKNIQGETQDEGKSLVLRLEPGEGNPRNSEGDFVELEDGRLLFVYSRYTAGRGGDHDPAFLAGRYSNDGGNTWSDDHLIVDREGDMNVMSVSLLRLQNGDIALFYLRKNSLDDCIPLMRISTDEAQTWSEPIETITDKEGYFVLNNDRVIQLENGRLLLAVALHQPSGGEWNSRGALFSYYSDDNGRTWTSSPEVQNPDGVVTQEPGLVELNDGRVMMFIRADAGVQYLSYSDDQGETWSPAEPSDIASPLSPASIKRIPSTGDLLMVWNNNDGSDEALAGKRTPLNTAVSTDDGKTWQHIRTLEDDPDGWYCYTSIYFSGDDIFLAYCAGNRPEGTGLAITNVTRLDVDWVYGP